jgi:hypothetical protein
LIGFRVRRGQAHLFESESELELFESESSSLSSARPGPKKHLASVGLKWQQPWVIELFMQSCSP